MRWIDNDLVGDLDDLVKDNERDGIADALAERSEQDALYARWLHLTQLVSVWRAAACGHLIEPATAALSEEWSIGRARQLARCAARVSAWAAEVAERMQVHARR